MVMRMREKVNLFAQGMRDAKTCIEGGREKVRPYLSFCLSSISLFDLECVESERRGTCRRNAALMFERCVSLWFRLRNWRME